MTADPRRFVRRSLSRKLAREARNVRQQIIDLRAWNRRRMEGGAVFNFGTNQDPNWPESVVSIEASADPALLATAAVGSVAIADMREDAFNGTLMKQEMSLAQEISEAKKLMVEVFGVPWSQAERLAKLEKQETDLSQFHKTISDQAIKISDLEKLNTANMERLALASENERKIADLEQGKMEKTKELKSLDNTILEQATNVSNLEREVKSAEEEITRLNQNKTDQNVKINELQREIEKLRKVVSDQSNKLNEAENLK